MHHHGALARKLLHQRSKVLQASRPNRRTTLKPYQPSPFPPCWDLGNKNVAAEQDQVSKRANQVSNFKCSTLRFRPFSTWMVLVNLNQNGAAIEHPLAK